MTCHGCNKPLVPGLFEFRTYHSGCDPKGRVEMLERALNRAWEHSLSAQADLDDGFPQSARRFLVEIAEAARAALEYRPAQMKGRE